MPSPMTTHDAAASSTAPLLDPAQVAAVRTSFAAVVPIADRAGIMLFDRIFELAPETRPMFADDIASPRRRPARSRQCAPSSITSTSPIG